MLTNFDNSKNAAATVRQLEALAEKVDELSYHISYLTDVIKHLLSGQEYAVIRGEFRSMTEFDQTVDRSLPEGLIK